MTNGETSTTEQPANVAAQGADVAPAKAPSKKGAGQKKEAPKGHKAGKVAKPAGKAKKAAQKPSAKKTPKSDSAAPREGSKTAQVVAMLQRKNGATLAEIMEATDWQQHTVRGFIAGTMKKNGYKVESFKSEKGERSYRIQ